MKNKRLADDIDMLLDMFGRREGITGLTYIIREDSDVEDLRVMVSNKFQDYRCIEGNAKNIIKIIDKVELILLRSAHRELEV